MKPPAAIWACDGETPYYYIDGEERPQSAVRYTISAERADILQELSRVRAERNALVTATGNTAEEARNAVIEAWTDAVSQTYLIDESEIADRFRYDIENGDMAIVIGEI